MKVIIKLYRKNSGQSLIQVIVSVGIMSIIAMVFASMSSSQQKQMKYLESKQEAIDSKNVILRVLSNSYGKCYAANSVIGDLRWVGATPASLSFQKFFETETSEHLSVANGVRGSFILDIQRMEFVGINCPDVICTADLEVQLRQKDASLPSIKKLRIPSVALQVETTGGVTRVLDCSVGTNNFLTGTVVKDHGICTNTTCTYSLVPFSYKYVNFESICTSKCQSGDGYTSYSFKDAADNVILQGRACYAGGVDHNQTNTSESSPLIPRPIKATKVTVQAVGCNASISSVRTKLLN